MFHCSDISGWEGVENRNKPEDLPGLWILAFGHEKRKDSVYSFYSDASRFGTPNRFEKIHSNCFTIEDVSPRHPLFFSKVLKNQTVEWSNSLCNHHLKFLAFINLVPDTSVFNLLLGRKAILVFVIFRAVTSSSVSHPSPDA